MKIEKRTKHVNKRFDNLIEVKHTDQYLRELKEITKKYGNDIPILTCCFFHYDSYPQPLEEKLSLRPIAVAHKDTFKILSNSVYNETYNRCGTWDRAFTHISISGKLISDFDIDGTEYTLKGESARTVEYIRNRVEQERFTRGEEPSFRLIYGCTEYILRFLCIYQPEHEDMIPICIDGYSMEGVDIDMNRMLSLLEGYLETVVKIYNREINKQIKK